MLIIKRSLPLYVAVIVTLPSGNRVVVNWATPSVNGKRPILTPSLKKVTVPVGLRELAEVTVAVKVTASPKLEGFALDSTVVCVANLAFPNRTDTLPLNCSNRS